MALSLFPQLSPSIPNPQQNLQLHSTKIFLKRVDHPFDGTPQRDVVSWTSSIAQSCRSGCLSKAAETLTAMRLANIEPTRVTFIILLSACADFPSEASGFGLAIHGYAHKLGWVETKVALGTALVGMYAKSGRVDCARHVFDRMKVRNSMSWNTMIDGYMRNGEVEAAVSLFGSMGTRDKVSWTALIGGFVKNGQFEAALDCFHQMQLAKVIPDYVTIISVLAACANLGALGQGIWVHRCVLLWDMAENLRLNNSLIDLYARCGCISFAHQVFDRMTHRSTVSWNSIIVGFATNGRVEKALEYFTLMQEGGFRPDSITFTGALTACSHAGLVDEGLHYYNVMRRVYGISPRVEHYGCIVDLLSRAGRLEDATKVVEGMPMKPNEVVLVSLLAACRTHEDVPLAEKVMNYIKELTPETDSIYVLLSNIYASVGRWDGVGKVRHTMKVHDLRKQPGFSSIEIDCSVHEFVSGDRSHDRSKDIYKMLSHVSLQMKHYGYASETFSDLSSQYD